MSILTKLKDILGLQEASLDEFLLAPSATDGDKELSEVIKKHIEQTTKSSADSLQGEQHGLY